jgi:serine/threonine protein kinase
MAFEYIHAYSYLHTYVILMMGFHFEGYQADSGVGGSVESSGVEAGGFSVMERRKFSEYFHLFVELCLKRQPEQRPSPSRLLSHSFFKQCRRGPQLSLASVISPVINNRASAAISQGKYCHIAFSIL